MEEKEEKIPETEIQIFFKEQKFFGLTPNETVELDFNTLTFLWPIISFYLEEKKKQRDKRTIEFWDNLTGNKINSLTKALLFADRALKNEICNGCKRPQRDIQMCQECLIYPARQRIAEAIKGGLA